MSSLAVAPVFGAIATDGAGTAPAALVVLSGGLVGMSIREMIGILGDDDGDDGGDDGVADGGGLVADSGDAEELGGLGGLDDEDDEFGDFGGGDEFDDVGDGGTDTDELAHRLDELETEVGSLSSTVNTVRNENEQISESVEEVEENVRKLLDIYEMVTRGVNPFADDMEPGGMGGAGGGSFGLFDDGGVDEQSGNLDDDVANADAEGFFDEDLVEDESSPADDVDGVMGVGDGAEDIDDGFEDEPGAFDDDFDEDPAEESDGESGKSFAELKDEYETGEADWTDEVGGTADVADELGEAEDVLDDGDESQDVDGGHDGEDLADDALFDDVVDETPDDASADVDHRESTVADPDANSKPDAESESGAAAAATADGRPAGAGEPASSDDKPYLARMPDGFGSELVVVEWLEFLVGEVGVRETARAIDYYERIDWIAPPVADDLQAYLRGFDAVDGGDGGLTIDHHTRSLRYVSQLDGGGADAFATADLLGHRGGGADGIQR